MSSASALRELQRDLENKANDLSKLQKGWFFSNLFELDLLNEDANVFKLIRPVLVKQDMAEANANVIRELNIFRPELYVSFIGFRILLHLFFMLYVFQLLGFFKRRLDATVQDLEDKQNSKKEAIYKLQQKIQGLQAGKAPLNVKVDLRGNFSLTFSQVMKISGEVSVLELEVILHPVRVC
ncbi:hypothetical protein MKW92_031069 [Papaver armeniacum]|nr:hypothetical protein MKW92_031069 [Papaver armeniacum]